MESTHQKAAQAAAEVSAAAARISADAAKGCRRGQQCQGRAVAGCRRGSGRARETEIRSGFGS